MSEKTTPHGKIDGIDGLRALSVLLVMVAHYGYGDIVPGSLGVSSFFFISGFLITTLLLREQQESGGINIRAFYIRRLLRLHPELLAYVALSGFVFAARPVPLQDAAAALFYFTNYLQILGTPVGPDFDFHFPHLWSLAVEEHYYLTFPLLVALVGRFPRKLMLILIGVCAVALILRQVYWLRGASFEYLYQATETRIDMIAYGCLCAVLVFRHEAGLRARLAGARGAAVLALGLGLLVASLLLRTEWFREILRYSVQGVAFLLIMLVLRTGALGSVINRGLDAPPLAWIGKMSYAAYLWHLQPVFMLESIINFEALRATASGKVLATLILCTVTLVIAYASHRLIYVNMLGLRRRFGSHA